jgi:haloacid dehalogenase-like hydrolase
MFRLGFKALRNIATKSHISMRVTNMYPNLGSFGINRRVLFATLGAIALAALHPVATLADAPTTVDALPSWNDGAAKQAIVDFVKATTDKSSPNFVPPEARIATFDQDGTLWVEHPIYSQVVYCLDRVPALVKAKPELANVEPFKTVMSGDREAMAKLSTHDLEKILFATLTGMTVDVFTAEAKTWTEEAKDGRWKRPYTELTYQPMQEVLSYLRANGFKTYIVTGGGPRLRAGLFRKGLWHSAGASGGLCRQHQIQL